MPGYGILLVVVITLLTSDAHSTATTDQTLTFTNSIVAETNTRRLLRVDKSTTDSYSFKVIDRGDNGGDVTEKTKVDTSNANNSEERTRGVTTLEKLKSSKTFKSLSRTMSRASNSFSDKISPVLSMKAKLQVWSNNRKSLDFVKTELKLDQLTGDALTKALKYYDDYVTSQLPIWKKNELTPDEVLALLGLRGLSGAELKTSRDFKHYDEFVNAQILVWGKEDLPVDDVLVRLGLNTLTGDARKRAVNYKYYDAFLSNQLVKWMKSDEDVNVVMARLNLNELSGKALLDHPNYSFYKLFMKSKLKSWATDGASLDFVLQKLGLLDRRGHVILTNPNYRFYEKYKENWVRYQEDGWLNRHLTTFDVWNKLEVYRVKNTIRRSSTTYNRYKNYVNKMDDYIIKLKEEKATIPDLISKNASPEELWEKTLIWTSAKRPDWYVKYSLGLEGLGPNALNEAPNLKLYKYYEDALNVL